MNVVAIEHHAGINSLLGANPLLLGILARQTRKARILSLGTLISLRPDPVRVAEEYATADVISRGRLEIGFVKSGGSEMASSNVNPVDNVERYWEAIDLITKALTSHDGPFSWEGKHFTHRHVNIWPRAVAAAASAHVGGDRATRRRRARSAVAAWSTCWSCAAPRARSARGRPIARRASRPGCPRSTTDHFGYAALVYVGDTDEEGARVGEKLLWFLNTSLKSAPQYAQVPARRRAAGAGADDLPDARRSRRRARRTGGNGAALAPSR